MCHLLCESYLHRLDAFAIQFGQNSGIRWYGLSYLVGILLGWLIARWMAATGRIGLTKIQVGDYIMYAIVGVIVGGRLGYVLFYQPELLFSFSDSLPFWGVFQINKGGMASHGGMIGVILACMLFARRRRISGLHMFDIAAFIAPVGLCLGRVANFVNGELWGEELSKSAQANPPWWSIKYPEELTKDFDFSRLDAVRGELAQLLSVPSSSSDATLAKSAVNAMMEGNSQVIELAQPHLTAYYPSQIIQAITDGPMMIPLLVLVWLRPRRPGVVGAWFLMAYGAMRILSEQFRQPDEGVERVLGLSRGSLLSVLMILAGAVGLWIVARRNRPRVGGLINPAEATKSMGSGAQEE